MKNIRASFRGPGDLRDVIILWKMFIPTLYYRIIIVILGIVADVIITDIDASLTAEKSASTRFPYRLNDRLPFF